MTLQDEIDSKRREIQTDGYPVSIGEILNLYRDGELDIHPEFQRFFRWSDLQKSRLLESILLGIPLPSVFVHQRADGVWDVVDGLQRLSTIFEFSGELINEAGERVPALLLQPTNYLPSLGGKTWEGEDEHVSLTQTQRLLIKRYAIDFKIIRRESDPQTKFDLFQRLNTGGSQLSDQELRNCLLILEDRTFYAWLKELHGEAAFGTTVAASDRAVSEQYDLELVLRFLALRNTADLRAIGDMTDFLTDAALRFARDPDFDRQTEADSFRELFGLLSSGLGDDAFRRYDEVRDRFVGGFSVSAFEALTIGVDRNRAAWAQIAPDELPPLMRDRVRRLWADEGFRSRSGSGFRASQRVPYTIPRGEDVMRP